MNGGRRIWRTAWNLLCALLAGAALLLLAAGGPPVSQEEAFRRLQREQFFWPYAQYQGTVTVGDRDWGVGLTDRWLLLGDMEYGHLYPWRRQGDGPAAAPVDCRDRETGAVCFLAAGAPEGTASAVLFFYARPNAGAAQGPADHFHASPAAVRIAAHTG